MSSSGSGNSSNNPNHGFPPMDNRFQDMRDKMNRDREAFFGTDSPQPFFGRESPFFRVSTLVFFTSNHRGSVLHLIYPLSQALSNKDRDV